MFSATDRPKSVPQLPYNQMYISFSISKFSIYFEVHVILIWSDCIKVSFDSRLAFNMYPSLLKYVFIIINSSILQCSIHYTTFAVNGKVERS